MTADAAYLLQSVSQVAHVRRRALAIQRYTAALASTLGQRYAAGHAIAVEDARRVADYVAQTDHTIDLEIDSGNVTIKASMEPFYTLVRRYLSQSPCARPKGRFRWWLIPLVLIGTTLIVYGETKEKKK